MDSVQKTDLTTDTSVGRTEVDTVDAGDFFEIAKPAEDFKISATNLILGLLKFAPVYLQGVPLDFNISSTTIEKPLTNPAGETITIDVASLHNKRIFIESPLQVVHNNGARYVIALDYINVIEGQNLYLNVRWYVPYNLGGTNRREYSHSFDVQTDYSTIAGDDEALLKVASGWYVVRGNNLLKI